MTNLVYRASENVGRLVYEASLNTGTTYIETLSTTQQSVASNTRQVFLASGQKFLTLAVSQFSQAPALAKARVYAPFVVAQASTIDLYTDTSLGAALTTVSQSSSGSVAHRDSDMRAATQSSVASVAMVVTLGTAHSTFFITLSTTQQTTASRTADLQEEKVAVSVPLATLSFSVNSQPTFFSLTLAANQASQPSLAVAGVATTHLLNFDVFQSSVPEFTAAFIGQPVFEDSPRTSSRTALLGGRLGNPSLSGRALTSKLD